MRHAFCLAIVLVLNAFTAFAAYEAEELGTFGSWVAYKDTERGKAVCYMISKPAKSAGDYTRRGDVFLTITHRPARKSLDVISVVAGYQYKDDADVVVSVDSKSWAFFTNTDRAWARDTATDKAVATAIARGHTMVVKGTSNRGTLTTDTFDLSGSSNAYKAINEACK